MRQQRLPTDSKSRVQSIYQTNQSQGAINMQEINLEAMNPKTLYQNVLFVRDEIGELLDNLAAEVNR
jgi:hypothetical protein